MKTRSLALPLVLASGLLSCTVPNRSAVEFAGICQFPNDCTFSSGKCDQTMLHKPWVDTAVADQFILYVQLDNQLANNANADTGKANTNDAFVEQFEVTYPGVPGIPRTTMQANGFVPAGSGSSPGTTVIKVWPVIPASGVAGLLNTAATTAGGYVDVVANLVFRGRYGDGSTFETGVFSIGFTVCSGCAATINLGCTLGCPPSPNQYGTVSQYGVCQ